MARNVHRRGRRPSLARRTGDAVHDRLHGRPRSSTRLDQDELAQAVGLRSLAIAPLVSERGALGTLTVFADRPGKFTASDANLLGVLADQAAIAMTNARLIEELERSQTALEARAERSARYATSPPGSRRSATPARSSPASSRSRAACSVRTGPT